MRYEMREIVLFDTCWHLIKVEHYQDFVTANNRLFELNFPSLNKLFAN